MIRLVSGTVADTTGGTALIETSGGIGYLVAILHRTTALPGEYIRLYTHLAVRETALDLYGFVDQDDLVLFELLLTISGIGPKSALQIMDQADRHLIINSVSTDDAVGLSKLSGMTKKTAEKVVLGLKDKIERIATSVPIQSRGNQYEDAFDTLVTLGYNPQAVRQTLDSIALPEATTSQIVAEALRKLS